MDELEYYGPPPLTKWQRHILRHPEKLEKKRLQNKEWRHRPENVERRRLYYLKNRERLNEMNKRNNQARRDAMTLEQKEEVRRGHREHKQKARQCPEYRARDRAAHVKWFNSDKGKEYMANTVEQRNAYMRTRRTDPKWKLIDTIRLRLYIFLKGVRKSKRTIELIGCTLDQLKAHLESQFQKGMTWQNHGRGKGKWHVDHIKALSNFENIHLPEVQRVAFHWSNLQPLWSHENVAKGNRRDGKPIGQLPLLAIREEAA